MVGKTILVVPTPQSTSVKQPSTFTLLQAKFRFSKLYQTLFADSYAETELIAKKKSTVESAVWWQKKGHFLKAGDLYMEAADIQKYIDFIINPVTEENAASRKTSQARLNLLEQAREAYETELKEGRNDPVVYQKLAECFRLQEKQLEKHLAAKAQELQEILADGADIEASFLIFRKQREILEAMYDSNWKGEKLETLKEHLAFHLEFQVPNHVKVQTEIWMAEKFKGYAQHVAFQQELAEAIVAMSM